METQVVNQAPPKRPVSVATLILFLSPIILLAIWFYGALQLAGKITFDFPDKLRDILFSLSVVVYSLLTLWAVIDTKNVRWRVFNIVLILIQIALSIAVVAWIAFYFGQGS